MLGFGVPVGRDYGSVLNRAASTGGGGAMFRLTRIGKLSKGASCRTANMPLKSLFGL